MSLTEICVHDVGLRVSVVMKKYYFSREIPGRDITEKRFDGGRVACFVIWSLYVHIVHLEQRALL